MFAMTHDPDEATFEHQKAETGVMPDTMMNQDLEEELEEELDLMEFKSPPAMGATSVAEAGACRLRQFSSTP